LTPTASGVLAVRLSSTRPDWLVWFRREQLQTVTWAGDPSKPMLNNDPLELSPRRSFAAWSEIVRGTAVRWSQGELATARAFGAALVGIIVQINAVRMLIAEQQLTQIRGVVATSNEPVVIIDPQGAVLFANQRFCQLSKRSSHELRGQVADLFAQPTYLRSLLARLTLERQSWRGEQVLLTAAGDSVAVAVRAEVVPARDGSLLGFFLLIDDLSELKQAGAAREHLEQSLRVVEVSAEVPDRLMSAILSNASLAAMDIAEAGTMHSAVPSLNELEVSTRRATDLYQRMRGFT
jgi:PAS domain S-box-containing protein